jgi:signal transduction histidine kinase
LLRAWSRLSLSTQLAFLILVTGVGSWTVIHGSLGSSTGSQGAVESLVLLTVVLTVVLVAIRFVTSTLERVVTGAHALVEGNYESIRVHRVSGPSAEIRELESAFDILAVAVAEREQILQSEMLQMREVEALKDEFVSTVSHELRTPLTSVRGALGLVLGGPLASNLHPKARDLLRIALQNSERLIRLINDILDIEKMEAGHMQAREERVLIADVLRTTMSGLQSIAHDAGVTLELELDETAGVTGESDRLVQVFTNLVSNAIKVSPTGESVTASIRRTDDSIYVDVTDRGPGIPEEFRERIFGKFQQAGRSAVRRPGGTGLGLAIARAITELHGGTIRFETEIGAGTTFTVCLPRRHEEILAVAEPMVAGPRVLLIEADDSMRSVLAAMCDSFAAVVTAGTMEEAERAVSAGGFDAVVLDPDLPGADGLQFVRDLRNRAEGVDIPVLTFSSRDYSSEELRGVTLSPMHAFIKSRDRESDVVLRLRAVLAVRVPDALRSAA